MQSLGALVEPHGWRACRSCACTSALSALLHARVTACIVYCCDLCFVPQRARRSTCLTPGWSRRRRPVGRRRRALALVHGQQGQLLGPPRATLPPRALSRPILPLALVCPATAGPALLGPPRATLAPRTLSRPDPPGCHPSRARPRQGQLFPALLARPCRPGPSPGPTILCGPSRTAAVLPGPDPRTRRPAARRPGANRAPSARCGPEEPPGPCPCPCPCPRATPRQTFKVREVSGGAG